MRKLALVFGVSLAVLGLPGSAAAAGSGVIEGEISPQAIAAEVEVCLVPTGPNTEACTSGRPDGTYRLGGVPTSSPQRVVFIPSHRSGYLRQYYNHAQKLSEAQAIVVGNVPLTHVDVDLLPGGAVTGIVSAAGGGQPLAEAEVCALTAGSGESAGCAITDGEGRYLLTAIPAGSYALFFRGDGISAGYAPEYYLNQPDRAHATTVTVTAGNTVTGIDEPLDLGGRIEGTVTAAASGAGLEGLTICLFGTAAAEAQRCTASLAGGQYSFPGLTSGEYTVGFDLGDPEIAGADPSGATVGGFLPQFYVGASTKGGAQTISLLAPSVVDGVDAVLSVPAIPPAPPAPPPITAPLVAAPPAVPLPPTKKRCKRGFHKKKVKGMMRCVKNRPKKHRRKGRGGRK